jgi:hypothetical protein
MHRRTWLIIFTALIAAGFADTGTFASLPSAIQAHDLSPVARSGGPVVLVLAKLAVVGGLALTVTSIRLWVFPHLERVCGLIILALAASWGLGAWTNVANAPSWLAR